jgi:phospholipid-transporting ATPase
MNSDESFAALVNTANPATSRYRQQETNNPYINSDYITTNNTPSGYPPQPNLMDPFFDDDDDDASHSGFTMYSAQRPMQSQESGIPLARSAAPPAGLGASSTSLATTPNGQPQGWAFDDDALSPAFSPAHSFPAEPSSTPTRPLKQRRKWKWPWKRDKELTGERVITLNKPLMNEDYCSNFVSTSKYNMVSFLPKFLTGVFRLVLRTPRNTS